MAYKRILTMQDISCIGQCSMTVAMPILSVCGHEVCILPSKLLSTHTGGFGKPVVRDLSGNLADICAHWQQAGITFDAIYTGYLGSVEAIEAAGMIMDTMLAPGGKIIIDPAMADHGKLYSGFDEEYAGAMIGLCDKADVILPNITEAAIMTGLSYQQELEESYITRLLDGLKDRNVILTGVGYTPEETGAAVQCGGHRMHYPHQKIGKSYHGTGDIFAACFTGAWMQGLELFDAVKVAADFTFRCIENTYREPAHWYGVKFETALPDLLRMLSEYQRK